MDAFAVSICKGLSVGKCTLKHMLICGLYFGAFQAIMPFIGYLLGAQFDTLVSSLAPYIAFILLALIGINMIRESRSKDEEEETNADFSWRAMLPLAVATSIDALAVGVSFAFLQVNILPAVCLIGLTTFACSIFGVKMDVEFKGGSMITLAYEGDADLSDLKSTIGAELGKSNLTLQTGSDISGNQTLTVTLPGSDTLTTEQLDNLLATMNEQYPDNNFVQNEVSNVDATIGKEFLLKSVVALVAACVLILLYVAYRFRKIGGLKAGSTAIVALLHDMFVVFGVFVLLRIPLNGNFIAALLTILGYSINDTVVIYDRIRENSALYGKKQMSLAELVNLSVNQSFARSLMTSITTCLALGVVCVVSVIYRLDSIYSFAFPLLFGMVSGVYSTICIATPLWVDWKNKKKAAKKA